MAKAGKNITASREAIDRKKLYTLDEAVKLVKDSAKSKFDETVEVAMNRSEEHTSELQSLTNLVCRLLLEKKKNEKEKESTKTKR